jgi:MFS family permease
LIKDSSNRGIIATCQSAVKSWGAEMTLRFLLGAAEAGFGPSIPFLLSFFYLRHELGIFLAAAPLASTFAGALAYGITSGHSKLANWRLLFLIEGIPTLLMVPVAYFFLPDSPGKAKFLTEEEKVVARARGVRQTGKGGDSHHGGLRLKDIGLTLIDAKAWFTAVRGYLCISLSSEMLTTAI